MRDGTSVCAIACASFCIVERGQSKRCLCMSATNSHNNIICAQCTGGFLPRSGNVRRTVMRIAASVDGHSRVMQNRVASCATLPHRQPLVQISHFRLLLVPHVSHSEMIYPLLAYLRAEPPIDTKILRDKSLVVDYVTHTRTARPTLCPLAC